MSNHRGTVNSKTADNVNQIAKKLNYKPNRAGKILALKKKKIKFGVILFDRPSGNLFFLDVLRGLQDRLHSLSEYGVCVEIRYSKINLPEQQVCFINELISLGISGPIIAPINHPSVEECLKNLTNTGFPVVTTNSDIQNCGRMAYVGCDYTKSGTTAAAIMHMMCKKELNIGIIFGSELVLCHTERINSFCKYMHQYDHCNIKK